MALGVLFSFYALSAIFVSTRIWIRLQRLTLDDWLIAVSMVICTVMAVFIRYQIYYGDGRHLIAVTMHDADKIAQMNFVAVTLWVFSITGTKMSILVQYLRLFPTRKTAFLIWTLMAFVVAGGIVTFTVVMTACFPLEAVWDTALRESEHTKCLNQRLFWQIQSAYEAATCWIMLGILVPSLWRLQFPITKRIGAIVLLGLSSSSCIASILRLKSAFDAIPKSADVIHDFTWTGIMSTVFAAAELQTAIICCSLPALMPLRFKLCPWWFRSRGSSGSPVDIQRPAPRDLNDQRYSLFCLHL